MRERWRIYYSDGSVVRGRTRADWVAAPDEGVQVVLLMEPYPDRPFDGWTPWAGARPDRQIWTGDDWYAPYKSYPPKEGELISSEEYERIWRRAFTEE